MNDDFSYNMYVKKKLSEWRDNYEKEHSKLNYTLLARTMEERFKISTSTQKIAAMFDIQSPREIKLQEIVALSQIFNIPLWDLCQFPNITDSGIDPHALSRENNAVHELNNKYYFTNNEDCYYCYYFKPKHYSCRLHPVESTVIEEAKMTISLNHGHTEVKLEELKSSKSFYGEPLRSFTLSGNLYHFENTEMAYSFISDETGRRAMAIMFSYLNLSADIRYYLTAGIMTFSLNQTHSPLFQKMAVFRVRQDLKNEENEEIIRGILSLNSRPLFLEKEAVDKLEENDVIKQLFSEYKKSQNIYIINESAVSDSLLIPDDMERMKLLLKLRKLSLNSAHEIVSETDFFADFIKTYQAGQLEEQNI